MALQITQFTVIMINTVRCTNTRYDTKCEYWCVILNAGPAIPVCLEAVTSDADLKKAIHNSILQKSLMILEEIKSSSTNNRERLQFLLMLQEWDRQIERIEAGSIIFSVMCPTLEALDDLYKLYTSDELTRMAISAYITDEYPKDTTLRVTIDETEWERCRTQLLSGGELLWNGD